MLLTIFQALRSNNDVGWVWAHLIISLSVTEIAVEPCGSFHPFLNPGLPAEVETEPRYEETKGRRVLLRRIGAGKSWRRIGGGAALWSSPRWERARGKLRASPGADVRRRRWELSRGRRRGRASGGARWLSSRHRGRPSIRGMQGPAEHQRNAGADRAAEESGAADAEEESGAAEDSSGAAGTRAWG
jgi:hypothetical protein